MLKRYLDEVEVAFSNITWEYQFVLSHDITKPDHQLLQSLYNDMQFTCMYNVGVVHCKDAYGLIVEHKDKWKLVMSGDTRPCQALVDAGKDATLLIHEANFEDSMEQEAIDKRHSTTKEAITVGASMNAKHVLLTHFSQRYPKVPNIDKSYQELTGIAFDMTRMHMNELDCLPMSLDAVRALFAEELKELAGEDTAV